MSNNALKTVDVHSMKEIDDANERINQRGGEIKEIDNIMKNLIRKLSRLEDRVRMLEVKGLE